MTAPGSTARLVVIRPAAAAAAPARRRCVLPDAGRGMGVFVCATRGTGKSRLLGRTIAWQDFGREMPLVVLDPLGGTIDNLLDKIGRQPLARRRALWRRVRYVDMNGRDGFVVPWPIYYQAYPGERLSARSRRFVEVVARADPALQRASIQGLDALAPIAQAAGIVLTGLGLGITELWDLVDNPLAWEPRLRALAVDRPETAAAVSELRALGQLSPRDRAARLISLRAKLTLFRFSLNFQAIFGASVAGINWEEVVEQKQAVLIDFREIYDAEVKRFCLLWLWNSFLTFVKHRGHGQMGSPISVIIDELSYLVGSAGLDEELLTGDLNELVQRIARSHGVWLTLATQELFQLPPQVRQTVLSMGTVIFGQTSDDQAAEEIARRYFRYDPYKVKKSRTLYRFERESGHRWETPRPVPAGEQTTEFTRQEQTYLHSRVFLDLQKDHFLVGQSQREGELPTALRPISVEQVDAGQYPQRRITDRLRSELMRRDGRRESEILAEIAQRSGKTSATPGRQTPAAPAITPTDTPTVTDSPTATDRPARRPATALAGPTLPPPPDLQPGQPGAGLAPLRSPRARKPPKRA